MSRRRIYYLFADRPSLQPAGGDSINEFQFAQALAHGFDVHYNGVPVRTEANKLGRNDGQIYLPKPDEYDLVITRACLETFAKLPGPHAAMAIPYDEQVFAEASAVLTTTGPWANLISRYNAEPEVRALFGNWYPNRIISPKRLVNIGQQPTRHMGPLPADHPRVRRWRLQMGNYPFVIGYFGRVDEAETLDIMLESVTTQRVENSIFAIASPRFPLKRNWNAGVIHLGRIPHQEMIYLNNACDVLVGGEDPANEFLASRKILDAIATRTPILSLPWAARREQLGEDYPLYYRDAKEFSALIDRLKNDVEFQTQVTSHLDRLAEFHSPDQAAQRLITSVTELIETL